MADLSSAYRAAADAIRKSTALIIAAGAGMGVDSGLPDFRGDEGFWKAYPPYARLGVRFVEAANPEQFERDPAFAWGFYGHRLNLYRATTPHPGFAILRSWVKRSGVTAFVVTSNVDGQFQKAGFAEDAVWEVHGSIHHLQCLTPCHRGIWASTATIPVDESTMRADPACLPRCPKCGGVARPNILMFGDGGWIGRRTDYQEGNLDAFYQSHLGEPMTVVEIGAGTAVPTIRLFAERLGDTHGATVIRINPREPRIAAPQVSIAAGAREALEAIDALL